MIATEEGGINRLIGIARKAAEAIDQTKSAQQLLFKTHGSGCENLTGSPSDGDVKAAVRVLVSRLATLRTRASALAMLPSASDHLKKEIAGFIR